MIFNCDCGRQVHLTRKKQVIGEIINLMCLNCLKEKKPQVYVVEYEIPPFRAIYHTRVFANNDKEAIDILKRSKEGWKIRPRTVLLEQNCEVKEKLN